MRTHSPLQTFILLTIITIIVGVSAHASGTKTKKFTKKDLPSAVLASFEKSYPKAEIQGVEKETEGKQTYYEIESIDGKTKRDLLYNADGSVFETEELIAKETLPKPVTDAVKKDHSKSVIQKAEKVTRGNTVTYELHLTTGKKTEEVVFDENGKTPVSKVSNDEKKGAKEEKDDDDDDDDDGL